MFFRSALHVTPGFASFAKPFTRRYTPAQNCFRSISGGRLGSSQAAAAYSAHTAGMPGASRDCDGAGAEASTVALGSGAAAGGAVAGLPPVLLVVFSLLLRGFAVAWASAFTFPPSAPTFAPDAA